MPSAVYDAWIRYFGIPHLLTTSVADPEEHFH
jgi:hypothetical protein